MRSPAKAPSKRSPFQIKAIQSVRGLIVLLIRWNCSKLKMKTPLASSLSCIESLIFSSLAMGWIKGRQIKLVLNPSVTNYLSLCQFLHLEGVWFLHYRTAVKLKKKWATCECLGGHMTHLWAWEDEPTTATARLHHWLPSSHMRPMVGHPQNHRGRGESSWDIFSPLLSRSLPHFITAPLVVATFPWEARSHQQPQLHSGTCTRLLSLLLKEW